MYIEAGASIVEPRIGRNRWVVADAACISLGVVVGVETEDAELGIKEPASIVTGRELALIRSLNTQFPSSQHLLCRWYVNLNVLAKTKQYFPGPTQFNGYPVQHPRFQDFLTSWNRLLSGPLELIYL